MALKEVQKSELGMLLLADDGTSTRFEVWSDSIVRVSVSKGDFPCGNEIILSGAPVKADFSVTESEKAVILSTASMAVQVQKPDMRISYHRADGTVLLRHTKRFGIELIDGEIVTPHWEADRTSEGKMKLVSREVNPGYRVRLRFDFDKDEPIFGLGSNTDSTFNRLDKENHLYQYNRNAPIPLLVSPKGYGVLVNTGAYSTFLKDYLSFSFTVDSASMADFFFIAGGNLDGVVAGYRALTGSVPMLPRWFYGFTQCKEHYHTQDEVMSVVNEYRRRRVPLDLIVQDWHYWTDDVWSDKSFDPARYPDPTKLCDDVHAQNAHIMISVWPNTRGGPNAKELWEKNQLFGDGEVYNVFDQGACETYWNQLNTIFQRGFDAWWCDCSEPYETGWELDLEPEGRKNVMLDVLKKNMDSRYVNLYSLYHTRNVYESQRKVTDRKRVVNLTRSGYAGEQRYGTIVWSGDTTGSWEELRNQIHEGLNFCVCGCPYWTLDIGGFFPLQHNLGVWYDLWFNHSATYEAFNDGYKEMYTRWFQYGAFLPMFRSHGTVLPREIWQFGEAGNVFYDTQKEYIELRYRLLPYLYSLAWQITSDNYTLMRMLAFDFPEDKEAVSQETEFMFGPSLLVCPVTEPMYFDEEGAPLPDCEKLIDVYLPAGADWYDFRTDAFYRGGQTVKSDARLETMPLFARAGSILPIQEVVQYADEKPCAPLELLVYSGADASFTLYEDSGDSYDYEKGQRCEYTLTWDNSAKTLTVGDRIGSFEGMCIDRLLKITVINSLGRMAKEVTYSGKAVIIPF